MIEINPKDSTVLTFEVDVSGTMAVPKPRLVIPMGEGVSLTFEGIVNDGKVEVNIQELLKLTKMTEFNGKLEVVVEDSIFTPWEEKIVIKAPKEVKAKTVATETVEKIVVKASGATKSGDVATPIPLEESPAEVIVDHNKIDITKFRKKSVKEMFDENL